MKSEIRILIMAILIKRQINESVTYALDVWYNEYNSLSLLSLSELKNINSQL